MPAAIPDIYADPRIPQEAYRPDVREEPADGAGASARRASRHRLLLGDASTRRRRDELDNRHRPRGHRRNGARERAALRRS